MPAQRVQPPHPTDTNSQHDDLYYKQEHIDVAHKIDGTLKPEPVVAAITEAGLATPTASEWTSAKTGVARLDPGVAIGQGQTVVYGPSGPMVSLDGHNVMAYGASCDGVTDDTAPVAAAFAAADTSGRPVVIPGPTLTGTINYRGQSIIGSGSGSCSLIGKPSQDVLHLDPTLGQFARKDMTWRGVTFVVNDTVNAAASFPQRGGAGNAGFAVDFANGAGSIPLMMLGAIFDDVVFTSTSQVAGGQNNSVGIYTQFQTLNLLTVGYIRFERLSRGWWDDYPTSNMLSLEHARDHYKISNVVFRYCGRPWRIVNAANWEVGQITVHTATGYGIEWVGVASAIRERSNNVTINEVMIEDTTLASMGFTGNPPRNLKILSFASQDADVAMDWAAEDSEIAYLATTVTGSPDTQLTVSGHRNKINILASGNTTSEYQRNTVINTGVGNRITQIRHSGVPTQTRIADRLSTGRTERHVPDVWAGMLGIVDPMPVSGEDWLIDPRAMSAVEGKVEGVNYSYVADSTARFGTVFRQLTADYLVMDDNTLNGSRANRVGPFLPKGRVRAYVCAKANAACTQTWGMQNAAAADMGSASLSWTTSYTVQSFDFDLSAQPVSTALRLFMAPPSGSGLPVSVAWVFFRPWPSDWLVNGPVTIKGALDHDGSTVGFYNTTPISKPTVTGSKGANAALTSLLTQLAALGIITDSSS